MRGSMDYSKDRNGDTLVVRPRGALNATTVPELEDALVPALDGVKELVMDLSELDNISSMGLRLLLSLYRRMEKQGTMRVVNARGSIAEAFKMTGFSEIF